MPAPFSLFTNSSTVVLLSTIILVVDVPVLICILASPVEALVLNPKSESFVSPLTELSNFPPVTKAVFASCLISKVCVPIIAFPLAVIFALVLSLTDVFLMA